MRYHIGMSSFDLTSRPSDFSRNQIVKMGINIRREEEYDRDLFDRFSLWNSVIASYCKDFLDDHYLNNPGNYCLIDELGHGENNRVEITDRVKTFDTIRQKLQRSEMSNITLPSIWDIAGVRISGVDTLDLQTELARKLKKKFLALGANRVDLADIRSSPHYGYRALHLRVSAPAGRVEVQIRTELQSAWANMYERAADLLGRGIRYGDAPEGRHAWLVEKAWEVSDQIYEVEKLFSKQVRLSTYRLGGGSVEIDQGLSDSYQSLSALAATIGDLTSEITDVRKNLMHDQGK